MQKADDSDEDSNFLTSSSNEESTSKSSSDGAEGVIPNDEVNSSLPFLQLIPYTHAFCRLLTCSLQRWHPALHEPNRRHAHSSKPTQHQLPQRLGPPSTHQRSHARRLLKMLKMPIALEMYQCEIAPHLWILQLPLKQWQATWSREKR